MPVYEYRCAECGAKFDLFVRSVTLQSAPICPECGSSEVKKAISLFGVGATSAASCSPAST